MLGERHPATLDNLNNLAGHTHESRGITPRQSHSSTRRLAIHKEVLGERHPDYATNLNNLAELLRMQGDYAAARPLLRAGAGDPQGGVWASATPTTPTA